MKEICPFCRKKDFIEGVVYTNAVIYDGGHYNVCCKHCNGPVRVWIRRTVILEQIDKGDFTEDDWGNKCISIIKKANTITPKKLND